MKQMHIMLLTQFSVASNWCCFQFSSCVRCHTGWIIYVCGDVSICIKGGVIVDKWGASILAGGVVNNTILHTTGWIVFVDFHSQGGWTGIMLLWLQLVGSIKASPWFTWAPFCPLNTWGGETTPARFHFAPFVLGSWSLVCTLSSMCGLLYMDIAYCHLICWCQHFQPFHGMSHILPPLHDLRRGPLIVSIGEPPHWWYSSGSIQGMRPGESPLTIAAVSTFQYFM